ncbi:uncharacterized protein si:dkey-196h17.9 [Mugil cephalus]|uniref:uncharacterized protein si:dkey-196h17.9 n=1 Tax=Mugil cephalus TaxID=48193 RepID=UPI001FB7F32C|nr:uncharacterized protein si:dkey-196h17.9 [Mugil cephalus]
MKMEKLQLFKNKLLQRSESQKQLVEKNNNDIRDGCDLACPGHKTQNALNTEEEQRLERQENITSQELTELLGVCSGNTSEGGSGRPVQQNRSQEVVRLIQKWVSENLPKPPIDLKQGLQQHLANVLKVVVNEFERLHPVMEAGGMRECLTDGCHRQTFAHLHGLLQNASSVRDSFVLMNWVNRKYLSEAVLGHPNHRLITDWEAKSKGNLLENVKKEVRRNLDTILENEKNQKRCDTEDSEAYMALYVDIIQCITAMPREAEKISSELCDCVLEICLKELLSFVRRYAVEQKEFLGKKAESDKPETIYFLKTLRTCKELKHYVQNQSSTFNTSVNTSLVAVLVQIEGLALKLLMDIVTNIVESPLQTYFKSKAWCFYLVYDLEKHFPQLSYAVEEQKVAMDEAYKIISHTYLKHLIRNKLHTLTKRWSPNVGQRVSEDEDQLHDTILRLAPGVQCNRMLQNVKEVLECNSIDMQKLIVARIQQDLGRQSQDLKLLSALLRWKGLSRSEVREVMDALPDGPQTPTSDCCFSCLPCW